VTELTYREAVRHALADELAGDPRVLLLGEDIAAAGGAFKVTEGLVDRFGQERVMDTPISEQAIVGAAIGAALKGMRPVVELMFADFAAVCFDQIANELAKYRYMTGGQVEVPVTIRMANGASLGFGAQHSQTVESWFLNVPGLVLVAPSTPHDAYGLLRAAIQSPDPVLFFEHKGLYATKGEVDRGAAPEALGTARIRRSGTDVTMVGTQLMAARARAAADELAARGIDAEVVDLRSLVPMDVETVLESVRRTGRLVLVQEGPLSGGWAPTLLTKVVLAGADVGSRTAVAASDDVPVPYAAAMESAWLPDVERIAAAAERLVMAS
jgi:acetoin:2,6-dichlorophenolindophenol oxidoreductase subunit beta